MRVIELIKKKLGIISPTRFYYDDKYRKSLNKKGAARKKLRLTIV